MSDVTRTPSVATSTSDPVSGAADAPCTTQPRFWRAGTLQYSRKGLFILFAWLLGNDLCLMLMEQVAPQLTPLLLKENGANNRQIAFYMYTLAVALTVWINPVVSTWSDRHRGPMGRRRPFLLVAAPLCAVALALLPYGPDAMRFLGMSGSAAAVAAIGFGYLFYMVFNSIILAIFTYYFWDVVPTELLGRFSALSKAVATLAIFIWNYFLFGLADRHMKGLFLGVAALFLVFYTLSVWRVKEGDYPPPEPRPAGNWIVGIKAYLNECFGQPYYLWVFAAMTAYQIGQYTNAYQIFYYRDTLGLSLDVIDKMRSWPSLSLIVLAFPMGVLIDRLGAVRLVAPSLILVAATSLVSFLFLRGPWSLLTCVGLNTVAVLAFNISFGVMNVEVFPRAKIGQFCSAMAITYQAIGFVAAVPVGMLFDYIQNYRFVFLWSATFQVLSALLFVKVYLNWRRRRKEMTDAGPSSAQLAPSG